MIQEYTNTTTATNYGHEQGLHHETIPVHNISRSGPFFRFLDRPTPPQYILTKTHCGGTCMCQTPKDYLETPRSFDVACRSGNQIVEGRKVSATYPAEVVKKAVHLLRHPLDNIVARLHMEQKKWVHTNDTEESKILLQRFNESKEGFQEWCRFLDGRTTAKEAKMHRWFDDELMMVLQGVPCHSDFLRYIQWHSLAFETTRRRQLPVHYLFYEDYQTKWETTTKELLDFLQLAPAPEAEPYSFVKGKQYRDYFHVDQIANVERLVRMMAAPEIWQLMLRYFQ